MTTRIAHFLRAALLLAICAINQSTSRAQTDDLADRVRRQDISAFRQAADNGRRDLIPTLEGYAEFHCADTEPLRTEAKAALAKLGDKRYLAEIVSELTATNSPIFQAEYKLEMQGGSSPARATYITRRDIRERAFGKLGYINDPSTIRTIAAFLHNTEDPNLDPGNGDAVYPTPAQLAVETLRKMVKYPPQNNDITTWQQWWEQNKDKYP